MLSRRNAVALDLTRFGSLQSLLCHAPALIQEPLPTDIRYHEDFELENTALPMDYRCCATYNAFIALSDMSY